MYNTWAYRCTKYERNRILSCDRDIDGPYRHSLLSVPPITFCLFFKYLYLYLTILVL